MSIAINFSNKYRKQFLDIGLGSLKTAFKKVVHKAGEFLGNKIAGILTKSNDKKSLKPDENSRNVEEKITPPQRKEETLKKLRQVL